MSLVVPTCQWHLQVGFDQHYQAFSQSTLLAVDGFKETSRVEIQTGAAGLSIVLCAPFPPPPPPPPAANDVLVLFSFRCLCSRWLEFMLTSASHQPNKWSCHLSSECHFQNDSKESFFAQLTIVLTFGRGSNCPSRTHSRSWSRSRSRTITGPFWIHLTVRAGLVWSCLVLWCSSASQLRSRNKR